MFTKFLRATTIGTIFSITFFFRTWNKVYVTGLTLRVHNREIFFLLSTKTYVVGTLKNCIKETVVLSTQNVC